MCFGRCSATTGLGSPSRLRRSRPRDPKSLMIYAGSNEIQVTRIAKDLLSS
jgi:hypothetical protein